MKTPRLSLAILALALAPLARAANLPTWTVVEEGSRAWPEIRFSVGGKPRALHCRFAECGPKAPKGQINLFLITKKGPGVPTKVTIYKGVQRGKWNPRRYTDGEWAYEPEVIAAMAYPWESELSHFKLDNTGPTLFVVQGKERYPATSDIDEAQYNSYDQMKIAPPKKMLDDELKPAAPPAQRSTWWCNQETGDIIGVQPGGKPPAGYTRLESRSSTCGKKPAGPARPGRTLSKLPTAGKWKDAITAVGEWRAIQTSAWPLLGIPFPMPTMTFYCYHEKMDGDKDLATHLKKHPLIVECVNWSAPSDDATKEEGGKKFKLRNNHVQFDLGFTNGKLQTLSGVKGVTVKELSALPDALGGEKFVKVTAPQTAPAAGASLALVAEETRWLTKPQAAAYADARAAAKDDAARKALDDKYSALVEAQTRPEAASAYKAARSAPAAEATEKIKAAVGGVEMWGGKDIKAIVAPFQEKADPATAKLLEIQLSKADWELLKKKPDDLRAYTAARLSANGASGDGTVFDANYLDQVALRLSAEAARKAVGSNQPVVTPGTGDEALIPLLTEDEKKLLTPSELKTYQGIYDSAPAPKEKDKSLQAEAKRLRDLIASEGRGKAPAYAKPGDRAAFDKLPEWQKKKFCDELAASTANLAADTRGVELGGGSSTDAKSQLAATDAKSATAGNTTAAAGSTAPAWAIDACKPYAAPPVATNPGGTRPPATGSVPTPNGVDVEKKEKEKSKWLTQDLLTSAAKGAMVGLLVGSLFGPVGLVAGPLLGAAMFYGLTKITS